MTPAIARAIAPRPALALGKAAPEAVEEGAELVVASAAAPAALAEAEEAATVTACLVAEAEAEVAEAAAEEAAAEVADWAAEPEPEAEAEPLEPLVAPTITVGALPARAPLPHATASVPEVSDSVGSVVAPSALAICRQ